MSTASQGSGAGSGDGGKAGGDAGGGAEGGAEGGSGEGGGAAGFDEPLVARVSRAIWKGIKVALGTAVFGGVLYCGYSIVLVLLPVGSSSNRIMRKASDILENDPEITKYFGSVRTFGIDLGGRNEGRRYYVPEYKYDDVLTGVGCVDAWMQFYCCCRCCCCGLTCFSRCTGSTLILSLTPPPPTHPL